ncbi:tetratricopeptide repeat protein [Pelagicoccus enzymogenes]|uniref:tetratricopeptide repeat protein n=1 Tax=Pelagicoccus enzymogenes TaxID=2773457 RepID=UPI00280DE4FB|nr:tetratricopeptide repeat protein [Pelagicoccus enzymogenes]MDQ8198130.1 tetratricopeptide repeat protein [Pelagicoccus enzymogenes]
MKSSLFLPLCAILGASISFSSSAQDAAVSPDSAAAQERSSAADPSDREALVAKIAALLKDVEENGASLEKLDQIGDLYLQGGDAQRAILVFEKAIEEFGGSEELFVKVARVMQIVGGPEHAVNALTLGLEKFPDSELLTYEIGKAYIGLDKPYAAISNLKKVIQLSPEKESYRYHLADAYRLQKKWEESSKIVEDLIDKDTEILEVYLMKGDLMLSQGEHRDGVRFLEDLLEEHPDSQSVKKVLVHAYQLYAYAESESGRLSRAVRSIRSALEVEPKNNESLLALANFLNQLGEYEEAETTFKSLLEENPNYLDAYVFYGRMLEELDRTQEAAAQYQKGLSLARDLGVEGAITAFRQLLRIK